MSIILSKSKFIFITQNRYILECARTIYKYDRILFKIGEINRYRSLGIKVQIIRNAPKVANISADVIGDICGVLSGAISALIAMKMTEQFGLKMDLQFLFSALVATLTVGGKALVKGIENKNATPIVHVVGTLLSKVKRKNK